MFNSWSPPAHWMKITTIETHAAGEPLRIITGGLPPIPGDTILEKRRFARKHLDGIRTSLMWEPRGHADMYGGIITEPTVQDSDLGVLFLHNQGFSTMCGHGIIALSTAVLETEMVSRPGDHPELRIDAPAGLITAQAQRVGDRITSVAFQNVPSFVLALDQEIQVPGIGKVRYDIAFGGAFYAFVRAADLDLDLIPEQAARLIDAGRRIKQAIMRNDPCHHPFDRDLGFLYGTIFTAPPKETGHFSRNVCIFADGELDRSPTGTGVSARAALHYVRREIEIGTPFTIESILDTCFTGRVLKTTSLGPHEAVVPEISGSASIVGRCEWWIDPDDPLKNGFVFR